jgi:hypothetical protein
MEERDAGVLALISQTTHPHPLAVVVIIAYNGVQSRATDSANLSNSDVIAKAITVYMIDNNEVPPFCPAGAGQGCLISLIASSLIPTYMSQMPNDASYPYHYVGTSAYNNAWSVRMYKRQASTYCKFGVYPSALDTWWSSAPKC